MYSYHVENLPEDHPAIWSQTPIHPLAPGTLTPFSFSVLSEVMGRAWFAYYDRLGFAPTPRTRLLRQYRGRVYQNLTLSAQLESTHAGIAPLPLRINDAVYLIAPWEKPGLLSALRTGRSQRKLQEQMETLAADADGALVKGRDWLAKTREMRWTQAEILQVMEEIERVSLSSLMFFFATRHNLQLAYHRLLALLPAGQPFPANLNAVNKAVGDVDGLVEEQMATDVVALADELKDDTAGQAWLQQSDLHDWRVALPNPRLRDGLTAFLTKFGHRAVAEGEIATPRWAEAPTPVLQAVLACAQNRSPRLAAPSAVPQVEPLLALIGAKQQRPAEELLQQIRRLLRQQSRGLEMVAYFLAGTRCWALAAGAEAASDHRLAAADDVFFFELEEMKQMMTGEWNVSDTDIIRATAVARRHSHAQAQTERPQELLIGDIEARSTDGALPGAAGQCRGPLHRSDGSQPILWADAVVGVPRLDSGWSLLLPVAQGVVTATGTPLDPVVAAARQWHLPVLLNLGAGYDALVEGAQTTIDVDGSRVDQ